MVTKTVTHTGAKGPLIDYTTPPAVGDALLWNGTSWVPSATVPPLEREPLHYLNAKMDITRNFVPGTAIGLFTKMSGYGTINAVTNTSGEGTQFTGLKAGRTYVMIGTLVMRTATNTAEVSGAWFDSNTGVQLGPNADTFSNNYSTMQSSQPMAMAVYTPTVDTAVEIRCTYESSAQATPSNSSGGVIIYEVSSTREVREVITTYVGSGGGTTINSLSDVADVDTTGVIDGQALTWNAATATWVPAVAGLPQAEFGEIQIPATPTVPTVYTDIATFTLPSAGTWEVEYVVRGSCVGGGYMVSCLSDLNNTMLANSELIVGPISAAGLQQTSTGVYRITTTGATSYKIRSIGVNGNAVIYNDVNGRSYAKWKKISGLLPVSSATKYAKYGLFSATTLVSTGITIADGETFEVRVWSNSGSHTPANQMLTFYRKGTNIYWQRHSYFDGSDGSGGIAPATTGNANFDLAAYGAAISLANFEFKATGGGIPGGVEVAIMQTTAMPIYRDTATLGGLTDVDTAGIAVGDLLQWNGSKFVPYQNPTTSPGGLLQTVAYDIMNDVTPNLSRNGYSIGQPSTDINVDVTITPKSSNSRFIVTFDGEFRFSGGGPDEFDSSMTEMVTNTNMRFVRQTNVSVSGEMGRSNVLLPLIGTYKNSTLAPKTFRLRMWRQVGDDQVYLWNSMVIIQEVSL